MKKLWWWLRAPNKMLINSASKWLTGHCTSLQMGPEILRTQIGIFLFLAVHEIFLISVQNSWNEMRFHHSTNNFALDRLNKPRHSHPSHESFLPFCELGLIKKNFPTRPVNKHTKNFVFVLVSFGRSRDSSETADKSDNQTGMRVNHSRLLA